MTDMTDIDTIIERVEAGETGEEIDREALIATGHTHELYRSRFGENHWRFRGVALPVWMGMPEISTSMDACIALMERVLPDYRWLAQMSGKYFVISKRPVLGEGPIPTSYRGSADTPAAALLIAILKAVKAEREAS